MHELVSIQQATAKALSEADNLEEALSKILSSVCSIMNWCCGDFWNINNSENTIRCHFFWCDSGLHLDEFREATIQSVFHMGVGLPGMIWKSGQGIWVEELSQEENFPRLSIAKKEGLHSAVGFPVAVGKEVLGVVEFFSSDSSPVDEMLLDVLTAIGSQIGQFLKKSQAMTELLESNAFKEAVLESALDCIVSMDHEGRVFDFNAAAESTFGFKREDVIGKDMANLIIPPDFREGHRNGLLQYLQNRIGPILNKRIEVSGMRKDGSLFPVELTVTVVLDNEKPLFTGFLRDITEKKKSEEALRSSEEMLRIALAAGEMGAWELNLITGQSTRDLKHDQCFGYLEHVEEWKYEDFLAHVHPEDRDDVDKKFKLALTNRADWLFDCRVVWPDGTVHWISAAGRVTVDRTGMPIHMAGLVYEITERKRVEVDLKNALNSRNEFLSIASHELKTPLTSLKLQLQMAKRKLTQEKLMKALEISLIQTDRLSSLVEDLLDVSRIGSGKMSFNFEEVDIADLVKEVLDRFAEEFNLKGTKVEFEVNGSCVIVCDKFRIEQVITNLLSNALKYGEGKPVCVSLRKKNQALFITVEDLGRGIAKHMLDKIFERFERAVEGHGISGLGLGLYISKQLVLAHRGKLSVESELGKGSKFIVELPDEE